MSCDFDLHTMKSTLLTLLVCTLAQGKLTFEHASRNTSACVTYANPSGTLSNSTCILNTTTTVSSSIENTTHQTTSSFSVSTSSDTKDTTKGSTTEAHITKFNSSTILNTATL